MHNHVMRARARLRTRISRVYIERAVHARRFACRFVRRIGVRPDRVVEARRNAGERVGDRFAHRRRAFAKGRRRSGVCPAHDASRHRESSLCKQASRTDGKHLRAATPRHRGTRASV